MKSKWFRKKEKEYKPKYEDFIRLRMKTYDYTRGSLKVILAIKGDYYDSRAYHRALAYHRRTVVIPEARKTRTKYINEGRMLYGKNFK